MMGAVKTTVEELPENRVRLQVEVPSDHIKHAVEHASSDLAASTKIPGFRKGKVPQKVLEARVGRDRIFSEAVESLIGGWFFADTYRRSGSLSLVCLEHTLYGSFVFAIGLWPFFSHALV